LNRQVTGESKMEIEARIRDWLRQEVAREGDQAEVEELVTKAIEHFEKELVKHYLRPLMRERVIVALAIRDFKSPPVSKPSPPVSKPLPPVSKAFSDWLVRQRKPPTV
jgi:hypothetical protein